jgi:hypothetical protein
VSRRTAALSKKKTKMKETMLRIKVGLVSVAGAVFAAILGLTGCATMDKAYDKEVVWADTPTVHVFTNTVVLTNTVQVVLERTNIVYVTNTASGVVSGIATREAVATNYITAIVTNLVPVFMTNVVQMPVTNLIAKPEVEAAIGAAGSVINTFAPGVGSIVALALGGLYHGYRQVRNRKVNEALVQGVETARAVLTTTPQGKAADAQLVKWLMDHQREAGVLGTVSDLVETVSDNPAARLTAQEIMQRVLAAQQRSASPVAAAA